MQNIGIWGVGAALPEKILTNFDLEQMVDTNDKWIRTRTGIRERRMRAADEATSDFGAAAAREAMERAGVDYADIDLIVCATYTPDELIPSCACRIHQRLGPSTAAAMDINAACTGFVYALSVAKNMIAGGAAHLALVIGADTVTPFLDFQDRNTCVLFGDGAGAAVVGPVAEGRGVLSEFLAADGSGADLLCIPASGSRMPATADTVEQRLHFMRMEGSEVFKFAVRALGESVERALERAGLSPADLDWIAPHQANIRIIEAASKRLGVSMERFLINIERYGNTSAATIPIVLAEADGDGRLKDGQTIALSAFGGGLTWGSCIVRWGR